MEAKAFSGLYCFHSNQACCLGTGGGGAEGLKDQKRDVFDLGFATRTSPSQKPGLPSHSLTFTAVKENIIKGSVKEEKRKE